MIRLLKFAKCAQGVGFDIRAGPLEVKETGVGVHFNKPIFCENSPANRKLNEKRFQEEYTIIMTSMTGDDDDDSDNNNRLSLLKSQPSKEKYDRIRNEQPLAKRSQRCFHDYHHQVNSKNGQKRTHLKKQKHDINKENNRNPA